MPNRALAISGNAILEKQNKAARKFAPISNFLKVLSQENAPGQDISYAEALARKAWQKAVSDDKDSLYWSLMVLERTEGKVSQKVELNNPTQLIEQIYDRLVSSGMPMVQIRNVLTALGVDESLLPPIEAIEVEILGQPDSQPDSATADSTGKEPDNGIPAA